LNLADLGRHAVAPAHEHVRLTPLASRAYERRLGLRDQLSLLAAVPLANAASVKLESGELVWASQRPPGESK
jgi:hypothetical protein